MHNTMGSNLIANPNKDAYSTNAKQVSIFQDLSWPWDPSIVPQGVVSVVAYKKFSM